MSDRYKSPVPLPNDYERELLIHLMEEAAEVIQVASKCLRFGLRHQWTHSSFDNAQLLSREVGNFDKIRQILLDEMILQEDEIEAGFSDKGRKLKYYMQAERGAP